MIMKTAVKLSARPAGVKRIFLILCLTGAGFTQPSVQAQDNAGAADLGRLFFSPAQRQELDRRRALNIQEAIVTVESLYTVNGHVARSSGKTTTWVNGATLNETYRPRNPAIIPLRPVEDEAAVDLRVGQTLDRNSGNINNGIAGGEIKIKPGTAPVRR
jgi:hypothetical protein